MKRQCVFIMTDTTRYDMLGCYGDPNMYTPNLDNMAQNGMRFERVYTAQPVCGPARSALFTGMFPHSNASWANSMPLGANVKHLGQYASAAGMRCAYIGKWHLDGGDYFGTGICPDGWDAEYWYDMKCYLDEKTDADKLRSRDSSLSDAGIDEEFTFAYGVTRRALDFIRRYADEDFLLVVSYDEPHDPYLCPPPFNQMYADYTLTDTPAVTCSREGKPEYQKIWAETSRGGDAKSASKGVRRLLRCNSFADEMIGRVLNASRQCAPDALCIYTSDHGDAMRAHGLFAKGPAVYDEIARVPLIFEGPGICAGGVYAHTVSLIDLPATVLDWLLSRVPVCFQGRSLLAQARGDLAPTGRPAFVEFNRYEVDHDGFGGFQPMRAVVTDEYKLALHLTDTDEFYDIPNDPWNTDNRINDAVYAGARDKLHDELLEWMNVTRDPFRGYQWRCRPWRAGERPKWRCEGYTRQPENEPGEPRQLDYSTGLPMEDSTRRK